MILHHAPPILLAQTGTNQTKGECMQIMLNAIEIYLNHLFGAGISHTIAAQIIRLLSLLNRP
jgi:hypothetical protein